MDSFARDGLPPREQWPDLLLLDFPERLNAAEQLLKHEGTAIAGGWSYAELGERAADVYDLLRRRASGRRSCDRPASAAGRVLRLGEEELLP